MTIPNFPIDIWFNVLSYLHTSEQSELFEAIPTLRSHYSNLITVIRFVRINDKNYKDKIWKERYHTNDIHTVNLPIESVKELFLSGCNSKEGLKSLKKHISKEISSILMKPQIKRKINTRKHIFCLQLWFDFDSSSTYESMEFYYPYLWPHFKNTPHSIEIFKDKQDSLLNLTKSKYRTLNLFDCCFSASLSNGGTINKYHTVISRNFKDLIIDTAPQLIQLKSGELIRTCHYFQDIPKEEKHKILDIHNSALKGISIVTPMIDEFNPKKYIPKQYRNKDHEVFQDHELNFTYKNWDIKMANLAYDTLIRTKIDSIKSFIQSHFQEHHEAENACTTFPFPNFPNIKLAQNNAFQNMNYSVFYEIIYHIFNNSSAYELNLSKDLENSKDMNEFWQKYIYLLFDHVYVSYNYLLSRGLITNNEAKFIKIQILGHDNEDGNGNIQSLVQGYTKYFNDVYHSDSRHLRLIELVNSSTSINLVE